tara:strand:+ start:94 stop:486 length:393 start_codon:yes stop_codon:yes gene_type:complete
MAHFAKVVNGTVTNVIVAEPEFFDTFIDDTPGQWIQTSYNTRYGKHYEPNSNTLSSDQSKALRKNFAWIGGTYDATRDAFLPPHKYASWTLNEDTCVYDPPIPMPNDGKYYDWDESAYQADNTKGWVEIT